MNSHSPGRDVGWLAAYDRGMRYAQRGGYTPAEQQRRERLRLQAAERFARGDPTSQVARDLRVTEGSVHRWRRSWRDGGTVSRANLASFVGRWPGRVTVVVTKTPRNEPGTVREANDVVRD